jgi:CubicO group peptidase (beta-lactamase class C family)
LASALSSALLAQTTESSLAKPDATAIERQLAAIARDERVPALGGAIVTRDGCEGVFVTGVRALGQEAAVTVDDAWHLGSCTKAMTATLIALLVERGDLAWERTLGELLPDLGAPMDAGYRDLTLVDLLAHRAGLPTMTGPDEDLAASSAFAGTLVQQRHELCRRVLVRKPLTPPRKDYAYSNLGYVMAGHIAEVATKQPFETLLRELLFAPLGMRSAGFGAPGTAAALDQPRGHQQGKPVSLGPDADNPLLIGPAGTVHASLADWAKFVQVHLRGADGDVAIGALTLHRATMARLHTAYDGTGERYGYGWLLPKRPWASGDHTVLTHSGSNTMWYCVVWCDPAAGFGVLAVTNTAQPSAAKACDRVAALLLQDHLARRKAAGASQVDAAGKQGKESARD